MEGKVSCAERIREGLAIRNMQQKDLCDATGIPKSAMSQYCNGAFIPKQDRTALIAKALDVSEAWLMGYSVPMEREAGDILWSAAKDAGYISEFTNLSEDMKIRALSYAHSLTAQFPPPTVAQPEQTVTFHPIGTVAAGYDKFAFELLEDDSIEIPESYLRGRPKTDYFLLRVTGDSMYPMYHDGDHVLVLRQDYLSRSGEIGVVLYEGDKATLKKVEYAKGEQWVRLVPINPTYKELLVEGADMDNYRILGVPRVIIREL